MPLDGLKLYSLSFPAMGTRCGLHVYAGSECTATAAICAAIAEVQRIEVRYSRYRPDSELSRINGIAEAGGSVSVDAETTGLLNYAFAAFGRSGGLFDITSGLLRKAWGRPDRTSRTSGRQAPPLTSRAAACGA